MFFFLVVLFFKRILRACAMSPNFFPEKEVPVNSWILVWRKNCTVLRWICGSILCNWWLEMIDAIESQLYLLCLEEIAGQTNISQWHVSESLVSSCTFFFLVCVALKIVGGGRKVSLNMTVFCKYAQPREYKMRMAVTNLLGLSGIGNLPWVQFPRRCYEALCWRFLLF